VGTLIHRAEQAQSPTDGDDREGGCTAGKVLARLIADKGLIMAIRVIKSSGDVYADLGIRKRRNRHHGSTLDSFLAKESAKRQTKGRSKRRYKSRMKAALHETTEGLFLAGMISEKRMKACDDLCLTKAGRGTAEIRRRCRAARLRSRRASR
jgi:hypothetical protein